MKPLLDLAYLAMDNALRALENGCDCGCTDEPCEALVEALHAIEAYNERHPTRPCCAASSIE